MAKVSRSCPDACLRGSLCGAKKLPAILAGLCVSLSPAFAFIDTDGNQLGDVWQKKFNVGNLAPDEDSDGDGFTNAQEFLFATDPMDPNSRPSVIHSMTGPAATSGSWHSERGKVYDFQTSPDLATWTLASRQQGSGGMLHGHAQGAVGGGLYFRVAVSDVDTDGDGVTDWEEMTSGFNPARIYSEGYGSTSASNPITDKERLIAALNAPTNTITVAAANPNLSENWPDAGRFVIRRTGNLNAVTVFFSYGGTATNGLDYSAPAPSVEIPFGKDEMTVSITPLADEEVEATETVTLTLQADAAYTLGPDTHATLHIADSTDGKPCAKAAARFLVQSTFGPAPAELERVKALGYEAWLDQQFLRGPNLHLPIVQTWQAELMPANHTNSPLANTDHRIEAWWRQTMRTDPDSDPLRQRMAFSLSQIFVISDRMASLGSDQRAMTSYYDMLLENAFGTYRGLLEDVTRHPWMGVYLSAMRNRKANPSINRFPDENYAREVLQLLSIGLWRLNPDGSQYLSDGSDLGPYGEEIPAGQPIPTYGQDQVSEIARIFTGMSYSTRFASGTGPDEIPTTRFSDSANVPWRPMRMFDGEHDIAAKTIRLPGMPDLDLPAHTGTTATSQTAGDADLTEFLDHLSNHPNVPPFISRLLIQRLVTSNPTPAYIGRVSAAFIDNGGGVRGDLKAVIRAILLDPEARDYEWLSVPTHGLVREPYTRYVAMARAFEAAPAHESAGGRYRGFSGIDGDFLQRPLSAPSVFNFYSPENKPAGPLRDAGLTSPEMQIINSVTSIIGPNRYSSALRVTSVVLNASEIPNNGGWTQLNSSTQNDNINTPDVNEALWNTRINEEIWLAKSEAELAPDAMVAKLDEMLCYGKMSQPTYRAVTRALTRLPDPFAATVVTTLQRDQFIRARLRNAIHLITTSADYAVLK